MENNEQMNPIDGEENLEVSFEENPAQDGEQNFEASAVDDGEEIAEASLTEGEKNSEASKKIKKPKKISKKKVRNIFIAVLAVLLIASASYFRFFNGANKRFTEVSTPANIVSNKNIEVKFMEAYVTDTLPGHIDETESGGEEYIYILVYYTVTNKTDRDVALSDYPYVSVCEYSKEGSTYKLVQNSALKRDYARLQIYGILKDVSFAQANEDLKAGETRYDADVFMIPKSAFDNDKYFISFDNIDAIMRIDLNAPATQ